MFLNYFCEDQRGVVFRWYRPVKVVGPGLVITIPGLDHVQVVDLGKALHGWEGYGKEELEQKIISLVLDSPDLAQDTAKKGRGIRIILKGIEFVVGAFLAVVGGIIIFAEIQNTIAGRTEPLSRKFIVGLLLLIMGLGMPLQVTVGPILKRWSTRRGRATRIVGSGGVLLLCAFLTVAGIMAILTAIQDMAGGQAHGRQLLFQFLGGTFFLIIGLGIAWLIFGLPRYMQRRVEGVQKEHPNAPWMWNKEWASGRMVQKPKLTVAIIFFVIGIVWIAGGYLVFSLKGEDILRVVDSPVLRIALLALFAFIGFILFFVAIDGIRSRKYGTTNFVMSPIPGAIGGQLSGTIETGFREIPRHGFLLDLSCSTLSKGPGTFQEVVWRETKEVAPSHLQTGPQGICFPVSFGIPENALETEDPRIHTIYPTTWYLKVSTDACDGNYWVCFEVPVYRLRGTT